MGGGRTKWTTLVWTAVLASFVTLVSTGRQNRRQPRPTAKPEQFNLTTLTEGLLGRPGYDSKIRPMAHTGRPVIVDVDIFINDISAISEVNMEYTITIYLRQNWVDERLMYDSYSDNITLNYNQYDRVWTPDLFFRNQKDGKFHSLTVPNRLLRLSKTGAILYSQRLSLVLSCEMDLKRYPMDNQSCTINIGSYGYTTDDLIFRWKNVPEPVRTKDNIQLPEFDVTDIVTGTCTKNFSNTGSFTCIYADIKFQRQFAFYLIQTYIPTILIVMLSWVSFWIDMYAVPARITLGLLTVLTMTTQSASTMERLPRVSYIKAIDLWQSVCLVFVFGSLIEYSVVNVLSRRYKKGEKKQGFTAEDLEGVVVENDASSPPPDYQGCQQKQQMQVTMPNQNGKRQPVTRLCADPEPSMDFMHPLRRARSNPEPNNEITNGGGVGDSSDGVGNNKNGHQNPLAHFPFIDFPWRAMMRSQEEPRKTWWEKVRSNKAMMVDVVSRVLFPTLFVVFNIGYWLVYYT